MCQVNLSFGDRCLFDVKSCCFLRANTHHSQASESHQLLELWTYTPLFRIGRSFQGRADSQVSVESSDTLVPRVQNGLDHRVHRVLLSAYLPLQQDASGPLSLPINTLHTCKIDANCVKVVLPAILFCRCPHQCLDFGDYRDFVFHADKQNFCTFSCN